MTEDRTDKEKKNKQVIWYKRKSKIKDVTGPVRIPRDDK